MKHIKKYISIFLSILLFFTTIYVAAPQETYAYTPHQFYGIGAMDNTKEIVIYKGSTNLYAGDFVATHEYLDGDTKYYGYLSLNKNVLYKSSKVNVATVDSKTGKITTVGTGLTTITIKYRNTTLKFKLRVLSKASLLKKLPDHYTNDVTRLNAASKAFHSLAGTTTKVTNSNRYKVLDAYKNYDYKYSTGYYCSTAYNEATAQTEYTYYIYSPGTMHAYAICNYIDTYAENYNPFTTTSKKTFSVKSIAGKNKTISLILNSKVSPAQIYGAKYVYCADSKIRETSSHSFPITVQDKSTGYKYAATATINNRSARMTIKLQNTSLKTGRTYRLFSQMAAPNGYYSFGDWLEAGTNTFVAK